MDLKHQMGREKVRRGDSCERCLKPTLKELETKPRRQDRMSFLDLP